MRHAVLRATSTQKVYKLISPMLPHLVNLAPRLWNLELKAEWGVTSSISDLIGQLELGKPGILPRVRYGSTLFLASDYSGEHKGATHEAFSFLLADLNSLGLWNELRKRVRANFLRDSRRMSFKGLNDRQKRKALLPFLRAADTIPGLLFSVLVEKRLASDFKLSETERKKLPGVLHTWPPRSVRKLLWISHLGALIVSGLSAQGQNLFWITDEDDIAANPRLIRDATTIMARITSAYLPHNMGHMRFGTSASDNGDLFIEDAVAIPDLAAGALAQASQGDFFQHVSRLKVPLRDHVSRKALNILGWIGEENQQALGRLSFVVSRGDTIQQVRTKALEFLAE